MRRVLVVNAGSEALEGSASSRRTTRRRSWTGSWTPTRSGTGSFTAGERFREPVVVDDEVVPRSKGSCRSRRCTTGRRLTRSAKRATRSGHSARGRVRHGLPRHDPRRGGDLRAASRLGHPPLRLPRPLRAVVGGARPVRPARRLPPRRGSSVTAVLDGRSVDTTMGFTPLEGVPMTTRSGSVDPGALLYVRGRGSPPDELDHALNLESGLAALSGTSGDLRDVLNAGEAGRLAFDVFVHRVAAAVAAMATSLGGLDALVFTAGIGERSATTRAAVSKRLAFLGVQLDEEANASAIPDAELSAPARVAVHVIAAREDVVIARDAARTLDIRQQVRGRPHGRHRPNPRHEPHGEGALRGLGHRPRDRHARHLRHLLVVLRQPRDGGLRPGKGTKELGDSPVKSTLALFPGGLIIVPAIWTVVTTFKRVQAAQRLTGQPPINGWIGLILYVVFSPAYQGYMQSGLNSVWRGQASAEPGGQVAEEAGGGAPQPGNA